MSWSELRATRAVRPGFASDSGKRATIYGAALEQAQQLFDAAAHVGPAARPILLFYGTAQLGRALVAASPEVSNAEAAVDGHGATPRGLANYPTDLREMSVVGDGGRRTSLGSLSRVLGACNLSSGRTLDDLIMRISMGKTFRRGDTLPSDTVAPLVLDDPWAGGSLPWRKEGPGETRVIVHAVPSKFLPDGPSTRLDRRLSDLGGATVEMQLKRFLDRFPGLEGWRFDTNPSGTVSVERKQRNGFAVRILIPLRAGETSLRVPLRVAERFSGSFVIYPDVDGCGKPDHPLVAWWATLLAFSSLARYHPDVWTRLIDIDRHEEAVRIEELLEDAVATVPQLFLDVLRGERMAAPK